MINATHFKVKIVGPVQLFFLTLIDPSGKTDYFNIGTTNNPEYSFDFPIGEKGRIEYYCKVNFGAWKVVFVYIEKKVFKTRTEWIGEWCMYIFSIGIIVALLLKIYFHVSFSGILNFLYQ